MATLYKANEALKDKIKKLENLRLLDVAGIFVAPILGIILAKLTGFVIIYLIGLAGFIIFFKTFFTLSKKIQTLSSGLTGEVKTHIILKSLPDTYCVIANANIEYDGQKSELDSIVIGPTGIFIIETKNYSGIIRGNIEDQNLQHVKISSGGNEYTNLFYNPAKQIGTHAYRLAGILKKNGLNQYVKTFVFFSDDKVSFEMDRLETSSAVFLKGREKLLYYLTTSDEILTADQIDEITCAVLHSAK